MNRKMIYLLCFLFIGFLLAGTDGTIRGRVVANKTGDSLPGVQIFIEDLGIGSV